MPERSTTSAIGSAMTRSGTNDEAGFDFVGSLARMRRQRSKFDRVIFRSRQKALMVWPDRFQASTKSRQRRTRSGLRRRMAEFSPPRKTHRLPDGTRRPFAGHLRYNPIYAGGATHAGCMMHVRRYFFDARLNDPERAHEALARIRALYAVEQAAKQKGLTGPGLAAYRQQHAGPVLTAFAGWLAEHRPRVLPKSSIGEAFTYATNQWPTLGVYLTDGRVTIDNAAAEQAIRPLAVGRRNWLHLGGDGGLKPTAVLLSICASIKRQGINPWAYLKHVLTELPTRPSSVDLTDLLPDAWARSFAGLVAVPA
jgi:hypothetical protein